MKVFGNIKKNFNKNKILNKPPFKGNYEGDYRNEIELLVKWSKDNNLILHVIKTKELIVDLRKCRNSTDSLLINGVTVEETYIYKKNCLTEMNTSSWTLNAGKIIKEEKRTKEN